MATKTSPSRRSSSRSKTTRTTSTNRSRRRPRKKRAAEEAAADPHPPDPLAARARRRRDRAGGLRAPGGPERLVRRRRPGRPQHLARPPRGVRDRGVRLPVRRRVLGSRPAPRRGPRGPGPHVHRVLHPHARCARDRLARSAGTRARSRPTPTRRTSRGSPTRAVWWAPLAAYPLSQVLSVYGAFVIDAGLALLGLLIFTGTPFSRVKERGSAFIGTLVTRTPDDAEPAVPMVTVPEPAEPKRRKEPSRRRKARAGGARSGGAMRSSCSPNPSAPPGFDDALPAAGASREAREGAHRHHVGGALSAPLDRPVAHRPTLDERRPARGAGDGGAGPHADDVRRRRAGRGRPPRSHRHDVRGGGGGRHQGQQGAEPLERHRLRARHARRADHRADPRPVGDRHRGPQQAPRLRDARATSCGPRARGRPRIPSRWRSARTSTASPRW